MNYEHRIKELEAEIEHVRKLQKIHRVQLDHQENWMEYTGSRMYAVEAAMEKMSQSVEKMSQTVDRFIASLQKGHNGHGSEG